MALVREMTSRLLNRLKPMPRPAVRSASVSATAKPPHGGKDFTTYPATAQEWKPFCSELIDAPLRENGFATFPFVTSDKIDALEQALRQAECSLDRSDVHIPTRFELSAFSNDSEYKKRIYHSVWNCLREDVEAILPEYEPLVVNVFDKPASEAYDPVPIHQNPSFVEEPHYRSVSLWIPLVDVDRENGTVGVLPGSHGRFNPMRSGNMAHEEIFADVQAELENELFVPVEMKKGEMLALDDSIIHWSYPNVSDHNRKAVQLIMVPTGVPHIYFYYDEEKQGGPIMDLYEVDHEFFFGFNCKARPETLKHIDRVPYHYRPITSSELLPTRSPA